MEIDYNLGSLAPRRESPLLAKITFILKEKLSMGVVAKVLIMMSSLQVDGWIIDKWMVDDPMLQVVV